MKNKTMLSSTFFLGVNLLLLASAILTGPIYTYVKNLVAVKYTYLYYHLFSLLLILFAVLSVVVSKFRADKQFKAGVCIAMAVISIVLYILAFNRLTMISVFGTVGSLFASRHTLALLAAHELTVAVTTLLEKKNMRT